MDEPTSPSFTLDACVSKLRLEDHEEYPYMLKVITLDALHPAHGTIGTIRALRVDREQCRISGEFLRILDNESQELSDFAFALFDKFGKLKPEFVDHEYYKGSGVWGRELDDGVLYYILEVKVKNEFRRRGVGSFLLQELSKSLPPSEGSSFFVAWPVPVDTVDGEEWIRQRNIVESFLRKNQYLRIGRTALLGFTPDKSHPSHLRDSTRDVNPHQEPQPPSGSSPVIEVQLLDDGNLHYSIKPMDQSPTSNNRDGEDRHVYALHKFIAIAKQLKGDPPIVEKTIRDAYAISPTCVRQQDDLGATPLHVAACFANLAAVRTLLGLPQESGILNDLSRRDNVEHSTPLEFCEMQQRSEREFSETFLAWSGHDEDRLRVVYLLKTAAGEELGMPEDEYAERFRYGCTCGQCTSGWLSPRMCSRLLNMAECAAEEMEPLIPFIHLTDETLLEIGAFGFNHLPQKMRKKPSEAICKGYAKVLRAISTVLRKPGPVPSMEEAVRSVVRDQAAEFFAQGGRVKHALAYAIAYTEDHSPLGENYLEDSTEDILDTMTPNAPVCANDLNFALVAAVMGVDNPSQFLSGASE